MTAANSPVAPGRPAAPQLVDTLEALQNAIGSRMRCGLIRLGRRSVSSLWASAVGVLPAPAKREGLLGQSDEVGLVERGDDGVEVELKE